MNYKRVYICHPYSSDPVGNIAKVKKIVEDIGKSTVKNDREIKEIPTNINLTAGVRVAISTYIIPVAAFLAFPETLSEGHITRQEAMHFCKGLLLGCDEIWVYGDTISSGMKEEIELASNESIPVVFK